MTTMVKVTRLRFELPREDLEGPTLEFHDAHFVQITYDMLRIGEDGDMIAYMNRYSGAWTICDDYAPADQRGPWSDVIIWET